MIEEGKMKIIIILWLIVLAPLVVIFYIIVFFETLVKDWIDKKFRYKYEKTKPKRNKSSIKSKKHEIEMVELPENDPMLFSTDEYDYYYSNVSDDIIKELEK